MDRRRAAGLLLALAACFATATAAPTASNHTALDLYDGAPEGCYYNFQHYGEGDRIMTNEPCLNCTCHNRMLMCYLRVCPFTKPIGQDCTIEKRADQCCPIVTCPDVPVDLLTSTTTSPAEYGPTGMGKLDKFGCSINGKYFSEGSKVPPTPNKPCEHCYCIRNMTTCVMQECTLHVDGCTPIYHKDVCCPVRYSCDHPEDEMPLLDDLSTTVRPTPGFLLTTTTISPVTQMSQDCVYDNRIFPDGALIKTEKACDHCYCMKGDIVCVVQECGTPMENEGKNCTALSPREGVCCPDTYICEGDEPTTGTYETDEAATIQTTYAGQEKLTTLSPPRRTSSEGSGYRNEPDNVPYTESPVIEPEMEGSGDEEPKTPTETAKPEITDDVLASTEETHEFIPLTTTKPKEEEEINTETTKADDSLIDSMDIEKTTESQQRLPSTSSFYSTIETVQPATEKIEDIGSGELPEDDLRQHEMASVTPASHDTKENVATTASYDDKVIPTELTERETPEPQVLGTSVPVLKEDITHKPSEQDAVTEENSDLTTSVSIKELDSEDATNVVDKHSTTSPDLTELSQDNKETTMKSLESSDITTLRTPIVEEDAKITTEPAEQNVVTNTLDHSIGEENLQTQSYPSSTSSPSVDDEYITTETQEFATERIKEPLHVEHQLVTASTPMLEEIEKDTTEYTESGHIIPSGTTRDDLFDISSTTKASRPVVEHTNDVTESTISEEHMSEVFQPSPTNIPVFDQQEQTTVVLEETPEEPIDNNVEESSKPKEQPSSTIASDLMDMERKTTAMPDISVSEYDIDRHESSTVVISSVPESSEVTTEPDKGLNTIPSEVIDEEGPDAQKHTPTQEKITTEADIVNRFSTETEDVTATTILDTSVSREEEPLLTTETAFRKEDYSPTEAEINRKSTTVTADITEEVLSTLTHDHTKTTETVSDLQHEITTLAPKHTESVEETTLAKDITDSSIYETSTSEISVSDIITEKPTLSTPLHEKETTIANQEDNEIFNEPRIPGEGDCLLNGVTYSNESVVPSTNKCQSGCKCISSIIKCDPIICSPPPQYMDNCETMYDTPDACCPTFICDHKTETMPPQSHSQMSGTETPVMSPVQCHGDECEINKDKKHEGGISDVCKSGDCGGPSDEHDKKTEHPDNIPEKPITAQNEECIGEGCKQVLCSDETGCQATPVQPCEGEKCESSLEVSEPPVSQQCASGQDCAVPSIPALECSGDNCDTSDSQLEDTHSSDACAGKEGCVDVPTLPEDKCKGDNCRRKDDSSLEQNIGEPCTTPDCKSGQTDSDISVAPALEQTSQGSDDDSMKDLGETTDKLEPFTELPEHSYSIATSAQPESQELTTKQPVISQEESLTTVSSIIELTTKSKPQEKTQTTNLIENEEIITEPTKVYTPEAQDMTESDEKTKPDIDSNDIKLDTKSPEDIEHDGAITTQSFTTDKSVDSSSKPPKTEVTEDQSLTQSPEKPDHEKSTPTVYEDSSETAVTDSDIVMSDDQNDKTPKIPDTDLDQEITTDDNLDEFVTEPPKLLDIEPYITVKAPEEETTSKISQSTESSLLLTTSDYDETMYSRTTTKAAEEQTQKLETQTTSIPIADSEAMTQPDLFVTIQPEEVTATEKDVSQKIDSESHEVTTSKSVEVSHDDKEINTESQDVTYTPQQEHSTESIINVSQEMSTEQISVVTEKQPVADELSTDKSTASDSETVDDIKQHEHIQGELSTPSSVEGETTLKELDEKYPMPTEHDKPVEKDNQTESPFVVDESGKIQPESTTIKPSVEIEMSLPSEKSTEGPHTDEMKEISTKIPTVESFTTEGVSSESYTEKILETMQTITPEIPIEEYVTTDKQLEPEVHQSTSPNVQDEMSTLPPALVDEISTTLSHDDEQSPPTEEQSIPVVIADTDKISIPEESIDVQTEKPKQDTIAPEEELIMATSKATPSKDEDEEMSTLSPDTDKSDKRTTSSGIFITGADIPVHGMPEVPTPTAADASVTYSPEIFGTKTPEEQVTAEDKTTEAPLITESEQATKASKEPDTSTPGESGTLAPEPPSTISEAPEEPITRTPEVITKVPDETILGEPDASLNKVPEESITAKPEAQTTDESEEPITSAPKAPFTTVTEQPISSEPEIPTTGELKEPITRTPEESVTRAPEGQYIEVPSRPTTNVPEASVTKIPDETIHSKPESLVTVEPEQPILSEPEAPVTRVPEEPVPSEPEVPVTRAPEEPVPSEPEAPVTRAPEEPVPGEPEAPFTRAPEEPVPSEPEATATRAPKEPVPTEPEAPATRAPEEPVPSEPEAPATRAPEEPVPSEPEAPATRAPEEPVPTEPEAPATRAPEEPVPSAPETPSTRAPEEPVPSEPEAPSTRAPEEPIFSDTEAPATRLPEEPVTSEPEAPATRAPEEPVPSEPEAPATRAPEESVPSEPEAPAISAAEEPIASESETPATTTPEEPVPSEPEAPATRAPKEPTVSDTEAPATRAPEEPVSREPEAPVTRAPEVPIVSDTEAPATRTPEEPISSEPEAPSTRLPDEPEAPATRAPEEPIPSEPEAPATRAPEQQVPSEPEALSTRAPEEPIASETEAPATKAPEEPVSSEPEAPATRAPEEPIASETEAPATRTPEESVPSEPEATATRAPEEAIASETEAPATGAPREPVPIELEAPATGAPEEPIASEPEAPATRAPEEPVPSEPEAPATRAPEEQVPSEPEALSTRAPEEPTVSETEATATRAPEEPVPSEPEAPATKAPGEPIPSELEVPVTRAPEEPIASETEAPATSAPEESIGSETGAPATRAPEEPVPSEPEAPAIKAPEEPIFSDTEAPATRTPEEPISSELEAPSTRLPEEPVTSEPEAPATRAPEKPVPSEPEAPATRAPEEPVPSEPEAPATRAPEKPVTSEPEAPATRAPEGPIPSEPEAPSTRAPEEPIISDTEAPATRAPEEPIVSGTEAPVTRAPEEPVTSEPEAPATRAPEEPVPSEPEAPATRAPEEAIPSVPEAPYTKSPEVPVTDAPITNASEEPIRNVPEEPITSAPETAGTKTPEVPATSASEAPTTHIPEAPITSAPEVPITSAPEVPITTAPELPKPVSTEVQPTDEGLTPDEDSSFPPSGGTSGYGHEPDYMEEDQTFGPGTCRYGGKVYVSAQQIPRDDPCDFCFCFRSDIICLQQSCPPPIHGCHEEPIQGFCCPRYECPVSMATTVNVTTTTTTTTTTLPPHFPTHSYKGSVQKRGCQIKGQTYKVGEVVRASSGPCLHCTCGGDGQMKCDPKVCTPEPMLRQMIAAAVSAKRRR